MHEQKKINEARHFLGELPASEKKRDKYIFTLSAFLSAARSVLQYAHKEAGQKPGGQMWYANHVAGNSIVSFLKDARDFNIHRKPVSPDERLGIYAAENLGVSESVLIAAIRADGMIETQELSSPPSPPTTQPQVTLTHKYFFQDWSGNEDVATLCQKYLKDVEALVADGVRKGFLTP